MNYVFWEQYNCQAISGLPRLIIMGVKALSLTDNVVLIANPDSLVYKVLLKDNVHFRFIDEKVCSETQEINSDSILIVPSLRPILFQLHKQNPRILLWQIYPSLCASSFYSRVLLRIQMKRMISKDAFISMDELCKETLCKELNLKKTPLIIPMPIDHHEYRYDVRKAKEAIENKLINISYLGRAMDWKIYSLQKLLTDLKNLNTYNFNIHVFTDDKQKFSTLLGDVPSNVFVTYYINLNGKELLDEMSKMQIHFAMGISALEGLAMGIPTISAPLSYQVIDDDYKYHWIYEDIEHYAGDTVENDKKKTIGKEISCLLLQFYESVDELSRQSYHAADPFSLEGVGKAIKSLTPQISLRQCERMMGTWWINKFKSIL